MREKKVRGMKRKSKVMVKRIEEETLDFPTHFYNGYWNLLLPVSEGFIDSVKTPIKIKRLCFQTLINCAYHLSQMKLQDGDTYRVAVLINPLSNWRSQLIVFKGNAYFNSFFTRDSDFQKWIPLPNERNIQREWGFVLPENFQQAGFKEIMIDEEESIERELWFIGELA